MAVAAFARFTMLLALATISHIDTSYPPAKMLKDVATFLDVDTVRFACNGTTDHDSQVLHDFHALTKRELQEYQKATHLDSLTVFPSLSSSPSSWCPQQIKSEEGEALLIDGDDVALLGFMPNLRQEVYLYNVSEDGQQVTLAETYSVLGGPLRTQHVGKWSEEKGLRIEEPNVWMRRRNLGGALVRNVIETSGRASFFLYDEDGKIVGTGGHFQEILNNLKEYLNFTVVNLVNKEPGKFGSFDEETQAWNGMVGMLVRDEADICTSDLSITLERSTAIDYSLGLFVDTVTLTVARPTSRRINFFAYLEIFSVYVWLWIVLFLGFLTLATLVLSHWGRDQFHRSSDPEEFSVLNAFAFVAITFLQNDYGVATRKYLATRFLFYSTCLFTYLLITSYVGVLTSFLTVSLPWTPVSSFEDALNKNFKILVWDSSSYHAKLRNALPGTVLNRMFASRVSGNPSALVSTPEEAADRLAADRQAVYFGGALNFARDERVLPLDGLPEQIDEQLGFGIRKGSELTPIVNMAIQEMNQAGILKRIENEWWRDVLITEGGDEAGDGESEASKISVEGVLFPFSLVAAGVAAAALMALAERALELVWDGSKGRGRESVHTRVAFR